MAYTYPLDYICHFTLISHTMLLIVSAVYLAVIPTAGEPDGGIMVSSEFGEAVVARAKRESVALLGVQV